MDAFKEFMSNSKSYRKGMALQGRDKNVTLSETALQSVTKC